jgi:hypothetical protein
MLSEKGLAGTPAPVWEECIANVCNKCDLVTPDSYPGRGRVGKNVLKVQVSLALMAGLEDLNQRRDFIFKIL